MSEKKENQEKEESQALQPTYVIPPGYYPEWSDEDEISLLSYVNVLLRRRWLILGVVVVAVAAAYLFSKLQSPTYEAEASFLVAENRSTQVLSDSEGLPVVVRNPVDYYKKIAVSHDVLDRLLQEEFRPREEAEETARLPEIWGVEGESPEERHLRSRAALKNRISLSSERSFPNLITLKVEGGSGFLAASVANALIEVLREYDIELNTASHSARIDVLSEHLKETTLARQKAKEAFQNFLRRNRSWEQSPELVIQHNELERDFERQDEIYNDLRDQMVKAQLARREKATSSAISVIDQAIPPKSPSSPRTRLNVALAGVVGLMLAVGLAFVLEFLFNFSRETEESREFSNLLAEIRNDFRRIFFLGAGKAERDRVEEGLNKESVEYR